MKLSFSTKGWHGADFYDFCDAALEQHFSGIELHNIYNPMFTGRDAPLNTINAPATVRSMYEKHLGIVCVDALCDPGTDDENECIDEITACIDAARRLKSPYIRVRTSADIDCDDADEISDRIAHCLEKCISAADKAGIVILIQTVGLFADTSRLRELLNRFACDTFAALWDMHATFRDADESAQETIKNLGAYVRHVIIKDSAVKGGICSYCLIGEGELPVDSMMRALRSVNYDGFISLEWDPAWMPELDDMDVIFAHFSSFMRSVGDTARAKKVLYENKAGTGKFVWKKETLIDETFSGVLDRMVAEFPDQLAFKYTTLDYTRTYSQFRDDVDNAARALISMGIRPGHHVAVWATNVPQWYIAFWATVKIGAVLVTVNTAYKIHELQYLLRQSDAHTLIMIESCLDSKYSEIVAELCPELENTVPGEPLHCKALPFLRNVITVGYKQAGCLEWTEVMERASRVPIEEVYRLAAAVDSHDVANMQYTSGTTGFPKGVMLTHHNIVNNGKCIGDRMDLSTADRMMVQVPMFHCFGMVLAMTASMTHGVTLLPLPYFSPKSSLACINAERVTAFHGVPTMFIAMLEHEDFPKTDFSYMRTGIMAGSPCPVKAMQDVVEKMHMTDITIVYGQTESSPGCTMSSTDDSVEVRVSTVGHPLPEIECKIVDPDTGLECPDNVNGEFVARGYNIMKGYYKMPEATAAAIDENGWLHTGDIACRTPEGNFRITGRLKDMIIRGGENIYPKEIEEFIYTHPAVRDVQVIGVPDEQYGEEILACVILKDGESITEDEMKSFIRDHMARHKVPKYISFVTEFPMNAAGKILKYKMREDAIEQLGIKKADGIVTE